MYTTVRVRLPALLEPSENMGGEVTGRGWMQPRTHLHVGRTMLKQKQKHLWTGISRRIGGHISPRNSRDRCIGNTVSEEKDSRRRSR